MPSGLPDLTNNARQARWRERKRAVREALAAGQPTTLSADETGQPLAQAQAVAVHLAKVERRFAQEGVRQAFEGAISQNAQGIADRLVSLALNGDLGAIQLIARTVLPSVKTEDRRVQLDLPPLDTLDHIADARRIVAEAVGEGAVGLADATQLLKVLESVEASLMNAEKREVLSAMRAALAHDAGGPAAHTVALAARAEALLSLLPDRPGGETIDASADNPQAEERA